MTKEKQAIAVVGLGYVGLPLALLAEKKGYKVTGIDLNEEKVGMLNRRQAPFADETIAADLKNSSLTATSGFAAVKSVSIIVICVPTPVFNNHLPDLEPVRRAGENIGKNLVRGQLVILESTVNPGVTETVLLPELERESGLRAGHDFYLAHCPERINPGDKNWRLADIPRVVGSLEPIGLDKALDFYRSILKSKVRPAKSLKEAEATKIVENTFRDINIAFVNELAKSFHKLGIDIVDVLEGAATKPFAFLAHFPGCGIGGHCIPVDPYYLIDHAQKNGFDHKFLKLAREINNSMPAYAVELLSEALNGIGRPIKGTKIGVLGLAYKPDIDDTRESPSFEIVRLLEKMGADLRVYDPFVAGQSNADSLGGLTRGAAAIVLATAHREFVNMDLEELKDAGVKVIIDGRNCLNKEKCEELGLVYRGIGR